MLKSLKKWFTLIELFIVIVIISVIFGSMIIYNASHNNQATIRLLNILTNNKNVNSKFILSWDTIKVCQETLTWDIHSFNMVDKKCGVSKDLLWRFKSKQEFYKTYNIFIDKNWHPIENLQNKYIQIKRWVIKNFSFNL